MTHRLIRSAAFVATDASLVTQSWESRRRETNPGIHGLRPRQEGHPGHHGHDAYGCGQPHGWDRERQKASVRRSRPSRKPSFLQFLEDTAYGRSLAMTSQA